MPALVVKLPRRKPSLFRLARGDLRIGRDPEAELSLRVSEVSRHHATVRVRLTNVSVEDTGSRNGTFVNGRRIEGRCALKSGDEVQIGPATLALVGDTQEDAFQRGRCVWYLPAYEPDPAPDEPEGLATTTLSREQVQRLMAVQGLLDGAWVQDEDAPERFWHPEAHDLTFGSGGLISVRGALAWGVVARLRWDGERHVLKRESRRVAVAVMEQRIDEQALADGDRFVVGGSRFAYHGPGTPPPSSA